MFGFRALGALSAFGIVPLVAAVASQSYTWKNVKIGGGGGFIPGIVFNPSQKGLAYARADIGGAYKLNPANDTWTPLLDWSTDSERWGVAALATDPVDTNRLYLATGLYTNSWSTENAQMLISTDQGSTFTSVALPFKVGGNMPGRGMGERLVVDPNLNSILYFGAASGNGLYKSTNYGQTWSKVSNFPSVGTYAPDPTDSSGYNSALIGIAWVTFDSTSGTKGSATPRIFVGVANLNSTNVYMTTDGGSTWSAVPGQPATFLPHKGVLSPAEKTLYLTFSDGAGPYDGTNGAVWKYNISTSAWTNITPVNGSDLYFGFGGLAVDLQKPGTLMIAALNSWWPDAQIYRSTDSGASWSALWDWGVYPDLQRHYSYDDSLAPWLAPSHDFVDNVPGDFEVGWMIESLNIDPFDSNHWLYGTGATIYGGHDLLKWDTAYNVSIKSLADGIEETAVLGLISPPGGPPLLSAVGDLGGFVHNSLTTPPASGFVNPTYSSSSDIDYAGQSPKSIVRVGTTTDGSQGKQVAFSNDYGNTWSQDYGAADGTAGGHVAVSADGSTILWSTASQGVQVSQYQATFSTVSSLPATAVIASDKVNASVFYGAYASSFYTSTDGGKTFAVKTTLGSSTAPWKIVVHPNVTGDVWVSTDKGLFHSTNMGTSFTTIPGVSQAWAIALGVSKTSGGYPALYASANIGGNGVFRSDDAGVNWIQIFDSAHGFGSTSTHILAGDHTTYGRVYIGTNGRGIFYGDIAGAAPPASTTLASTSTSVTSTSASTTSRSTTTSSRSTTTSSTVSSTISRTSTSTSTSASSTSTGVASVYGQCGGSGWTGPTTCAAGSTCTFQNTFYSQCIPN